MPKKILSKIKKSLYVTPFDDEIQHTRQKQMEKKSKMIF